MSRDNHGRYVVRLPFISINKRLGESRSIVFKRLLALKKKLRANVELNNEYTRIIDEYIKLTYLSVVENSEDDSEDDDTICLTTR